MEVFRNEWKWEDYTKNFVAAMSNSQEMFVALDNSFLKDGGKLYIYIKKLKTVK